MGAIGFPETSVRNYHCTREVQEERISELNVCVYRSVIGCFDTYWPVFVLLWFVSFFSHEIMFRD